jgi:hypothetical protein
LRGGTGRRATTRGGTPQLHRGPAHLPRQPHLLGGSGTGGRLPEEATALVHDLDDRDPDRLRTDLVRALVKLSGARAEVGAVDAGLTSPTRPSPSPARSSPTTATATCGASRTR